MAQASGGIALHTEVWMSVPGTTGSGFQPILGAAKRVGSPQTFLLWGASPPNYLTIDLD